MMWIAMFRLYIPDLIQTAKSSGYASLYAVFFSSVIGRLLTTNRSGISRLLMWQVAYLTEFLSSPFLSLSYAPLFLRPRKNGSEALLFTSIIFLIAMKTLNVTWPVINCSNLCRRLLQLWVGYCEQMNTHGVKDRVELLLLGFVV